MEVEDIHSQVRKRWRVGNGRNDGKIGHHDRYLDEDEENGESEGRNGRAADKNRLLSWHSSRIFRVSRTSGGKDRHSKVWTAKGVRDRRVRLSVSTAIQFYDLQDRLGYDQPSKAIEWLIKKAEDAINELPSLNGTFPATPKQTSNEKRPGGSETVFEPEAENEPTNYQHQQPQELLTTKSAGSSTSETSKGSVPSLSRSENRVKARERARERAAKEKEAHQVQQQNANLPTSQSSFTELLTGGDSNNHISAAQNTSPNFIHKQFRRFPSTSMDYFTPALFAAPATKAHNPSGFSSQSHIGSPLSALPLNVTGTGEHPELQQFSFLPDHLIPVAAATNDYNLNFSISSSLAGFNRGTLQSNSTSSLPHLQRFPSPVDGPINLPFFIGATTTATSAENQFPSAFDGRLQLCYSDGCRHSDLKGKGRS